MKIPIRTLLIFCLSIFAMINCSDNSNPEGPGGTNTDISGIWIANETVNGNCQGSNYPIFQTELFSVEQNGSNITFKIIGENNGITGTISGSTIVWQYTDTDGDEVMVTNFSGTVSRDKKTISGSATWTWTDNNNGYSCSGTTTIKARKAEAPSFSVNGIWQGDWLSDAGYLQGTFEANINQDNSLLSGTIDIPGVFFSPKDLKGVVSGDEIIFGDIDDEILFAGFVESTADSAFGTYFSEFLDDSGSWQGRKTSDSLDKHIVILDSIELTGNCTGDITFDGVDFWCISQTDKIYRILTSTGIIDSIDVPGMYPQGLTYDGNQLIVGDGPWGMGKLFKLDVSGKSVIQSPGLGDVSGMAYDGTYLWTANDDYSNKKIYKINNRGAVLNSFNCPGDIVGGMTYDGVNLRLAAWESGITRIYRIDLNGNIIDSFIAHSFLPGGLTFDGTNLWYVISSDSIAQIDDSGIVISKFKAPGDQSDTVYDLAFDGTNLWQVRSNMGDYQVHQIDLSGTVISTINWPGNGASGLTFDGTALQLSDYVTEKIYSINLAGDSFFDYPNSNDVNYLTTNGSILWGLDESSEVVTQFDYSGSQTTSFITSMSNPKGIVHDGSNLWIANGFVYFEKLTGLDVSGNVISEYTSNQNLLEPIALSVDGTNLWYLGGSYWDNNYKLYKLGIQ